MVHTCNPSIEEAEARGLHDFKASLGYVLKRSAKSEIIHFTLPKIGLHTLKMPGGRGEKPSEKNMFTDVLFLICPVTKLL